MGNVRFDLKVIVGALLFLTLATADLAYGRSCERIFSNYEQQSTQSSSSSFHLANKTNLKIVNWNLLDFKISVEHYENGTLPYRREKHDPESHRKQISSKTIDEILFYQKTMQELDADIYVVQEAIGKSLKYFAKHFLGDKYHVVLESSKKETELQIAFLVKKTLEVDFEVHSFDHLTWRNEMVSPPRTMPIFHKDLPALYLRQKDGKNVRPSNDPNLVIFGAHLKSMRHSEGDRYSTNQRTLQAQTASRIIHSVNQRYNYRVPIMLTGDLNADVITAKEFESFRFFLKDSIQISSESPVNLRYTHTYNGHRSQLDSQMINDALKEKLVESHVEHPKGNKSDHSPVVSIYDMTK